MIGLYTTSGFSSTSIPICANMQNTSLSGDAYLSGVALNYWNKDFALAKIGVRISKENAFPISGEKISIVYDSNIPPTTATMKILGSFFTRTSGTIENNGEWQPLDYTSIMYEDQYEYFENPSKIYAFSSGHTQIVSGSSLSLSGDYLTDWPNPVSA